jgi:hypothetical protein
MELGRQQEARLLAAVKKRQLGFLQIYYSLFYSFHFAL